MANLPHLFRVDGRLDELVLHMPPLVRTTAAQGLATTSWHMDGARRARQTT